jgi:hypothetical protein
VLVGPGEGILVAVEGDHVTDACEAFDDGATHALRASGHDVRTSRVSGHPTSLRRCLDQ